MRNNKKAAAKLLALWLSGLAGQELQKIEKKLAEPENKCTHSSTANDEQRDKKACK